MEYRIEKVKDTSQDFEGLEGMYILTFISNVTGEKRIDGPMNLDDYDKYYEWLRKETNKWCISISDNLEDFKREFVSDPGEFIPNVPDWDELEDLAVATLKDIMKYKSEFDSYFKDAKKEVESD